MDAKVWIGVVLSLTDGAETLVATLFGNEHRLYLASVKTKIETAVYLIRCAGLKSFLFTAV